MKEALQQLGINFISNFLYKHGEIDIFIPDKKIAIFVDGTIWHGDPLYFQPDDNSLCVVELQKLFGKKIQVIMHI
jgi:G:T-mismatch repair DNA endonuclease (very short patch repair protein)